MHNSNAPGNSSLTRRGFVGASAGLAAASTLAIAHTNANAAQELTASAKSLIAPGSVVLFQGDSITDAGRSREDADTPNKQPGLGNGYAWIAATQLLVDRPDHKLVIYNRGISGNKVFQLAERWQAEALDLKPTVLSILIGVNDIWHKLNGQYDGTVERYESDYNDLVARTKKALPDVKLVICEPFVLRCGSVTDKWFPEFDTYRAAAKRVAEKAGAVFVPFQRMFDKAVALAPPEWWAKDGVHPSADGAALMAHTWRQHVDGSL